MGRRAERKRRFLTAHPLCCFCGGKQAATTIDHIPARGLFLGRVWPDGYEFPACEACNAGASDDELLMSVAIRIFLHKEPSEQEERELELALSGVKHRHPNLLRQFRELTRVETRRFLRERGHGTTLANGGELYVMNIPPEMSEAYGRYGTKLAKALHYLHAGKITPATAEIKVRALTNADLIKLPFPADVLNILTNGTQIGRGTTSLAEQFSYRFAITDDAEASAFWVTFGESTAMLLAVFSDAERYARTKATRLAGRQVDAQVVAVLDTVT